MEAGAEVEAVGAACRPPTRTGSRAGEGSPPGRSLRRAADGPFEDDPPGHLQPRGQPSEHHGLADVKDRDSIVGKITFDDHGQNSVPVITKYVVQDGKFVEWEDSEYAAGKRKLPSQK